MGLLLLLRWDGYAVCTGEKINNSRSLREDCVQCDPLVDQGTNGRLHYDILGKHRKDVVQLTFRARAACG
jgi:hypothetical protein